MVQHQFAFVLDLQTLSGTRVGEFPLKDVDPGLLTNMSALGKKELQIKTR